MAEVAATWRTDDALLDALVQGRLRGQVEHRPFVERAERSPARAAAASLPRLVGREILAASATLRRRPPSEAALAAASALAAGPEGEGLQSGLAVADAAELRPEQAAALRRRLGVVRRWRAGCARHVAAGEPPAAARVSSARGAPAAQEAVGVGGMPSGDEDVSGDRQLGVADQAAAGLLTGTSNGG